MGDVFDRHRINQMQQPLDDGTQDIAIRSWCHTLDRHEVPWQLYGELYERCVRTRAAAMSSGEFVPQFGIELMVSEWPALEREIRQREIDSGRLLSQNAETNCPHCFGSGYRYKFDADGVALGVTGKPCDHTGPVQGKILAEVAADVEERPITREEFETMHSGVKLTIAGQKKREESAADILWRLGDEVFDEADSTTDQGDREYLREIWLKLRKASSYARKADAE